MECLVVFEPFPCYSGKLLFHLRTAYTVIVHCSSSFIVRFQELVQSAINF